MPFSPSVVCDRSQQNDALALLDDSSWSLALTPNRLGKLLANVIALVMTTPV